MPLACNLFVYFFRGYNTELRFEEDWLPIDFNGVVIRKILRSSGLFLKITGINTKNVKVLSISPIHYIRYTEKVN